MSTKNIEVTTFDKFSDDTKSKLKCLSLTYYEDPFLDNVIFISILSDKKKELDSISSIRYTETSNAIQTDDHWLYD